VRSTSSLWCHAAIGISLEWCCIDANSSTSTATTLVMLVIQACYHLLTSLSTLLECDAVLLPVIEACYGKAYVSFTSTDVSTWQSLDMKQSKTTQNKVCTQCFRIFTVLLCGHVRTHVFNEVADSLYPS
jgi:uncharacterized membrane protein YhiD involved in acid resistance